MVRKFSYILSVVIMLFFMSQCGVENLIFNNLSSNVPEDPGNVENRLIAGVTGIFKSGTADIISSTWESVAIKSGTIDADGKFVI
jgi:hypothetical protein